MKKCMFPAILFLGLFFHAGAGEVDLRLEGGAVWFSRNDVRIPGDEGTRFDMLDLTGTGPDAVFRVYAAYAWNERHSVRLTLAPLEVSGTGFLDREVRFRDAEFAAGTPTRGTYRFNTYRLTYRWMFQDRGPWRWGVGAALLVRDAEISLEQAGLDRSRDDLGLVPLLHLYGAVSLGERLSLVLDVEGAGSSMGRAVDAALLLRKEFDTGWHASAGVRTLEGGADNDDVYTFAWLHTVQAAVGFEF